MSVRNLLPQQIAVLRIMADGPVWLRTLQSKGLLRTGQGMTASGLTERCKPDGGKANNMLRLTERGEEYLASLN